MTANSLSMQTSQRMSRGLLLCGVLAPPVLTVFVMSAALLTPGYSHITQTVSQLGAYDKPHPEVMNTGLAIYGLMIGAFGYGLHRQLGASGSAKAIWILLSISGLGILMSGVFQTDPRALDAPTSTEGMLHGTFAYISFSTFAVGACIFARVVYRDPAWRGFAHLSLAVVALSVILTFVFRMDSVRPVEGLVQRAAYGTLPLWVEAVAIQSLRLLGNARLLKPA